MDRLPASPLTEEQGAWLLAEKERTGETAATVIRALINDAIKAQEAKSNENSA